MIRTNGLRADDTVTLPRMVWAIVVIIINSQVLSWSSLKILFLCLFHGHPQPEMLHFLTDARNDSSVWLAHLNLRSKVLAIVFGQVQWASRLSNQHNQNVYVNTTGTRAYHWTATEIPWLTVKVLYNKRIFRKSQRIFIDLGRNRTINGFLRTTTIDGQNATEWLHWRSFIVWRFFSLN